jgi:ATP-dependent DNA ligase
MPSAATAVNQPADARLEAAHAWLMEHTDAGIERVVAKRLDQAYRPGMALWSKVKTQLNAERWRRGSARAMSTGPKR